MTDADQLHIGSLISKAVGRCPEAVLQLGSEDVRCLLDTGAQVSTVTESFFKAHLEKEGCDLVDVSSYIKITGASGFDIPYLGYVELDVHTLGRRFPRMGFLIVKDSTNSAMLKRKRAVPGVIGSNIFHFVAKHLACEVGKNFLSSVMKQPGGEKWAGILAMYGSTDCAISTKPCLVRTMNKVLIPARSLKVIECITKSNFTKCVAIVERLEAAAMSLPNGLAVAHCLVSVQDGPYSSIPVQIANMADHDVYLAARTAVGSLSVVESETNQVNLVEVNEHEAIIEPQQPDRVCPGTEPDSDLQSLISRMNVADNLPREHYEAMMSVLAKHADVFSRSDSDIGCCDAVKHKIPLIDDRPVRLPHRRIPPHQWPEVREHLKKSLDMGIIRPSSSPYASAVVVVRKPSGKIRLCIDYRHLNAKTYKDAYPLPRIDEALEALKGAQYFTSLDLAHGFHQIAVDDDDVHKTAFRVGSGGLYEYVRMPMGLCNAPATFMKLMDKTFGDENFQSILVYLDDILIFGSTPEEMLQRLDMVLTRLGNCNLKVKPEKCHLFKEELRYLGHLVSAKGVAPDPQKIATVKDWSICQSYVNLRSFMGLAGYYC